ncbi:heterodisulfide reductase subunit A [candidate division LCP-89 bacterium B3_LCP]|uniref:Heterodisulfide reductase subunit A n=1 Tax=candidate division LCP-89 bacterium B3_LCP TaxID=2012998 RepID=A0A532V0U2_UNCL8|nr:MAG: heterodisulfide reductase subunit A [candidate division LCP-89 bacterium B3_LCP]
MEISGNGDQITADILVVGGGIAGITAAIEASEIGKSAVLVEKEPFLGGRVAKMNQYFPKLCPPLCGLEINFKRLRFNDQVKIMTLTTVEEVTGKPGDFEITLKVEPRYVKDDSPDFDEYVEACPIEVPNQDNFGIDMHKAVYLPQMAYPSIYAVDPSVVNDDKFKSWAKGCKTDIFDLDMKPETVKVKAAAIIWATGWQPYDAAKIDNLGFGKHDNVVTNVIFERLASADGPTQGKIQRPSDNAEIKKIGFVQCAGSRDENHLPYCSAVCCAASIKQANYVREQHPEAEIHIFYIDVRTPGRLEDFYASTDEDEKIFFHRGKVAEVREVSGSKNLIVAAENTLTGKITEMEMDMVVLATGMVPNSVECKPPVDAIMDDWGFLSSDTSSGVVGAGVASRPFDVAASVQDATGSVLKALQMMNRS